MELPGQLERKPPVMGWIGKIFGKDDSGRGGGGESVLDATVKRSARVYEEIPLRDFIDEARRSQLARELFLEVNAICNTIDPVVACRDRFAATVLQLAMFQVLMIPPPPEDDLSGLRGQPGISGQLKEHLASLSLKNDDLRSAIREHTDAQDFDSLWPVLRRLYWETWWLMQTLNAARIELGDFVEDNDWDLPFLHAACVKAENTYRFDLDLPSVFDAAIARDASTAYSVFTDIVLAGAADPVREWREYHRDFDVPLPDFGR
jgi:hypothetical protein